MGQACSGSGSKSTEKNKEKIDKNKPSELRPVQLATRPVAVKASKQAEAVALNAANNPHENHANSTLAPNKHSSGVLSVGQLMVQLTTGGRKTSSQQQQRSHHDEITYNVEVLQHIPTTVETLIYPSISMFYLIHILLYLCLILYIFYPSMTYLIYIMLYLCLILFISCSIYVLYYLYSIHL